MKMCFVTVVDRVFILSLQQAQFSPLAPKADSDLPCDGVKWAPSLSMHSPCSCRAQHTVPDTEGGSDKAELLDSNSRPTWPTPHCPFVALGRLGGK